MGGRWSAPRRRHPDIVEDGVNGLLVPAGDSAALAAAIEQILDDDALAARLGAAAAESAARWVATPAEYAERMAGLVAGTEPADAS